MTFDYLIYRNASIDGYICRDKYVRIMFNVFGFGFMKIERIELNQYE